MSYCNECGMPVKPNEYHPYAACLMFKACHSSSVVQANLDAVAKLAAKGKPDNPPEFDAARLENALVPSGYLCLHEGGYNHDEIPSFSSIPVSGAGPCNLTRCWPIYDLAAVVDAVAKENGNDAERGTLKVITENDKRQIMKMLHIEGEYADFGIDEIPIGVLKAMAHAVRYGRIQGAKTTSKGE
jgi:hypothetical protein